MKRVVCFGDSITKGESWFENWPKSKDVENCYPNLLARQFPNLEFVNKGIHKNTSRQALERFDKDALTLKPDFLIILLGSNDANINWMRFAIDNFKNPVPLVSLDEFRDNLLTLLDKSRQNAIFPILATLPPIALDVMFTRLLRLYGDKLKRHAEAVNGMEKMLQWHSSYSRVVEEVSKEKDIFLVDIRKDFLNQPNWKGLLSIDGIHPLPSGYKVIADSFYRVLKNILK